MRAEQVSGFSAVSAVSAAMFWRCGFSGHSFRSWRNASLALRSLGMTGESGLRPPPRRRHARCPDGVQQLPLDTDRVRLRLDADLGGVLGLDRGVHCAAVAGRHEIDMRRRPRAGDIALTRYLTGRER